MRNKLTDLNDYLFEQIERINDDSLSPEEFEGEMKRAEAVSKIAGVIVQNGKLQLDAVKFAAEYGMTGGDAVPTLFLDNGQTAAKLPAKKDGE